MLSLVCWDIAWTLSAHDARLEWPAGSEADQQGRAVPSFVRASC